MLEGSHRGALPDHYENGKFVGAVPPGSFSMEDTVPIEQEICAYTVDSDPGDFTSNPFFDGIDGDLNARIAVNTIGLKPRIRDGGPIHIIESLIEIGAVNDSEYYARLETEDETFGESVRSRKTFRGKNSGSELSGTTVVLVTEHGDIEVSGDEAVERVQEYLRVKFSYRGN